MTANTPPKPHTEGMEWTNTETGIKYQFSGGAWRAISSEASEEVAEAIDNLDLQKVLNNGNVADKGATFSGKVIVEPGTTGNEVVTFGQLVTLEEEIEQLAPTLERGTWNFTTDSVPGTGEYTLIKEFLDEDAQEALCQATFAECILAADGDVEAAQACSRALATCQDAIDGSAVVTTNVWSDAESIVFNEVDANGVLHNFGGIDSDHLLDVFNEGDSGYMVGDILTHGGGSFQFDLLTSVGVAAGLASIKIFKCRRNSRPYKLHP